MRHFFKRINQISRVSLFGISAFLGAVEVLPVVPPPPKIEAKAYILMDYDSGKILASHHADEKLPPASLTKMMTLYALNHDLERGTVTLDDLVPISSRAYQSTGSRMFVEKNTKVSVFDLMKGIVIQSGNDASVAIAEYLAGDETTFAELMNLYAQQLHLDNTHFDSSTGLPSPENYTTAYDLALLSQALIRDYPETYYLYSEKSFTHNNIEQKNRNRLLWESPLVDGIKTGSSQEAGECIAASAVKDKMRLIAVVLGLPSDRARTFETMRLFSYGFRFYKTLEIPADQKTLPEQKVAFGVSSSVPIVLKETRYLTIPSVQESQLVSTLHVKKGLRAPLSASESVGFLRLSLSDSDEVLMEVPVYPAYDLRAGGLWVHLKDNLSCLWHSCWG